jgi:hypothetical protein
MSQQGESPQEKEGGTMIKVNLPKIVWQELQSQLDDREDKTPGSIQRKVYDALDAQYGQARIKLSNECARQLIIEIRDEADYMFMRADELKRDGESVAGYRADARQMLRVADSIERKLPETREAK